MFNYKESKEIIERILETPTQIVPKYDLPSSEYEYSFTNSIKTWAGCLIVDIIDSHHLFANADETTVKIMRSLFSQIKEIMKDDINFRKIGTRDDCMYSIYNLSRKEDLVNIFNHACTINTFMTMFNKILLSKGLEPIQIGIGLGCDYELIVKLSDENDEINDKLWIGNAIGHATYYANVANRNGIQPIVMSKIFYDNVIKVLSKEEPNYINWIKPYYENGQIEAYQCNMITSHFNEWINEVF